MEWPTVVLILGVLLAIVAIVVAVILATAWRNLARNMRQMAKDNDERFTRRWRT